MFENWKNFEGTYISPIVLEQRMTTIEEMRQSIREKTPEVNEAILERLEIVEVKYLSKDKKVYVGQIVVDRELVNDMVKLFEEIEYINNHAERDEEKFYIDKIIPISNKEYGGDDESSMGDNNTSAHNYRTIKDSKILSLHAFGFAIDINPKDNPLVKNGEENQPRNGKYDQNNPNTLTTNHKIVSFLRRRGFEWGGEWESSKGYKDYQHFERVIPTKEYIDNYLNNVITNPNITKEDVVERIKRLILTHTQEKYIDNLTRLIADPKIRDIIGEEEHQKFSLFLREDLGDQF